MFLRGLGWTTFFDARAYTDVLKDSRSARLALPIVLGAGALCLAGSVVALYRESALLRSDSHRPATPASSVTTPRNREVVNTQSFTGEGFVSELPEVAPSDSQFRFAAKLAREQDVSIVQMQSESVKSDPATLGQTRLVLQVRGDYRGIKNLWSALLAKYPGLTLERLTLRHHDTSQDSPPQSSIATALPPADRGDDEANLELIQYTQPKAFAR